MSVQERSLIERAETARLYDLSRPLVDGMPQSADHPPFKMSVARRHGDLVRVDGSSGSNEIVFMSGHIGTHVDALSHASFDGRMYDGVATEGAIRGNRYTRHGAEEIGPWVCRGVLLDVAGALGVERLEADHEITAAQLDDARARAGVELEAGDVILIRTGWSRLYADRDAYIGTSTGTPGPGAEAGRWLAERRPRAVGGDTIAFERLTPPSRPVALPVHKIMLVDHGIHIIELLDLELLAAAGVSEFLFVLSPLPLVGATGAPVRPLALVEAG
jgi:kynurenine formamidase